MVALNTQIIRIARRFLKKVVESGIHVEKAYLYGSYAYGRPHKDSDIDVAVVSSDFSGNRFDDLGKLTYLRHEIDLRIEPMGFRPEDFDGRDLFADHIKKHGIEILT